jgi:hypothetical protein
MARTTDRKTPSITSLNEKENDGPVAVLREVC